MKSLPTFQSVRERTFWVRFQLRLMGTSFAEIADANNWARSTISAAMYIPSDPQEKAIASALGVAQEALFPERFDKDGRRLHQVKNKANRPGGNVKESKAA